MAPPACRMCHRSCVSQLHAHKKRALGTTENSLSVCRKLQSAYGAFSGSRLVINAFLYSTMARFTKKVCHLVKISFLQILQKSLSRRELIRKITVENYLTRSSAGLSQSVFLVGNRFIMTQVLSRYFYVRFSHSISLLKNKRCAFCSIDMKN